MVKNKILFYLSGLLLLVCAYFVIDRILFLFNSERTVGTVASISSYNSSCGGGKNSRTYPCTKFNALINFRTKKNIESSFKVSAGSSRGNNKPYSMATSSVGRQVPVVYSRSNPKEAYRDSFADIWGTSLITLLMQLSCFFGSFFEKRRSYFSS